MSATLRYEACSDSKNIACKTIQRPDLHSPRNLLIRQKQSSVPLHHHQIRIKPDMSINLDTKYNSIWDMFRISAAHDHDNRKTEDHLSPNMSDLTQVVTYQQKCRRQERETSSTLNYSYTVVKSAITCICNSDCSRKAKSPIAANTFTPHLHIEYTFSRV